jgi:peptidoglycan hydrolase-like protein with peptidoglycan-binding domain
VAQLKAAGKSFVMEYLNDPGGKGLTKAQLQTYLNGGIQVGLFWEGTGQETKSGAAAGTAAGNSAKQLLAGLGLPNTTDVHYAVDYDVTTQLAEIDAFLNAASAAQGHKASVYGEFDVIEHCVGNTALYGCQTYAWSSGKISSKATTYQYLNGQTLAGNSVDLERNLKSAFGAINGATLAPSGSASSGGGYNATAVPTATVQAALIKAGYDLGPTGADGVYGPKTTAAIHQLEVDHHLTVDVGIVGPQVLSALGLVSQPAPKPAPASAKPAAPKAPAFPLPAGYYFGVKSGPVQSVSGYFAPYGGPSGSAALKEWQQQMKNRGNSVTVDGLFGPQMQTLVENFQKQCKVTVDQKIGPVTWALAWTAPVTSAKLT